MRKTTVMLIMAMLLAGLGCRAEGWIITARTVVAKWGQMPVCFEIEGQALPEGVAASDFTISGEASAWGASGLHPFSCGVRAVEATEGGWRLVPERFPDKYFYVASFEVACASQPALGFAMRDISATHTETVDDFTLYEDAAAHLTAHVFLPDADAPLPVMIVFHGFGDTENLLTYRTAVAWAEPESQAVHPCAVIAPSISDDLYFSGMDRAKVFEGVMAWVDGQVEAGRIDPKRVYAMGNSFGGMSAFELAEQYPDRIAAVLALCPALNYSPGGMQRLGEITHIPATIVQAEHDETIPVDVGREAAAALEAAGNPNVTLRVYTDEEMVAAGAALGFENTYSFHHVELAAMEPPEFEKYADWLFAQATP